MSRCSDIQGRAVYLAALPKADPERQLAYEHARGCSACAEALAEGERIIALVDQLPPPPPPTEEALKRAREPILRQLEAQHRPLAEQPTKRRSAFIWLSALAAGWSVAVMLAKHRAGDLTSWLWSAVMLCTSLAGVGGIIRFDVQLTAAAVAVSGGFSSILGREGMLFPAIGVKCVLIELIAASLPLATTAVLALRDQAYRRPWRFAAAASLGALAGQAGLHLTCPAAGARPHLLVFHTGGVLIAALIGLVVSRIPRLRPSPAP